MFFYVEKPKYLWNITPFYEIEGEDRSAYIRTTSEISVIDRRIFIKRDEARSTLEIEYYPEKLLIGADLKKYTEIYALMHKSFENMCEMRTNIDLVKRITKPMTFRIFDGDRDLFFDMKAGNHFSFTNTTPNFKIWIPRYFPEFDVDVLKSNLSKVSRFTCSGEENVLYYVKQYYNVEIDRHILKWGKIDANGDIV